MMTVAAPSSAPATITRGAGTRSRRRSAVWLGLIPFGAYVLIFLVYPAILAVGSGFFTKDGTFTFANLTAFAEPSILTDFWNSIWISAATAVIGAIVGAIICFALLGTRADGFLRTVVDSASSVLAQFGGVMLAFAFIASIGAQGYITKLLVSMGWVENPLNNFNNDGVLIYQVGGLVVVYLYFQIPLMVLTFMPAMAGLRATWAEANATLGGTRLTYWTRIGMPILAPAFFGSTILLFGNSFSSFATAAVLIPQGGLTVLDIRRFVTSETLLGKDNVAGALALGMVVVMVVVMIAYSFLQRRAARWQR
jgi:putative spermidine/putrescine transport system permease protein